MSARISIDYNQENHYILKEVQKKVPYSKSLIRSLMLNHKFPIAYVTTDRKRVWDKYEIDEYVKNLEKQGK